MEEIKLEILLQDLRDRYTNWALTAGVTPHLDQRLQSKRRLYYAIEEAIKQFIAVARPAMLPGYQSESELENGTETRGLMVFEWPEDAATSRIDGGLVNIIVDGEEFTHFPVTDPAAIQVQLNSLQQQAESPLLYDSFVNYLIDLNTKRIYIPKDHSGKIRYIKAHDPFDYAMSGGAYNQLPEEIPIDASFTEELSVRALQQLVGMIGGGQSAGRGEQSAEGMAQSAQRGGQSAEREARSGGE